MEEIHKILKKACSTSVLDLKGLVVLDYFGSTGGSISSNFLVQFTDFNFPVFIIKVAPIEYGVWNKKKVVINNSALVEVEILKLLNKEILKNKLTPCLPALLGAQECSDIDKIIKGKCKKITRLPQDFMDTINVQMCYLQELYGRQLISPRFQLSAIEYGGIPVAQFIQMDTLPQNDKDYFMICFIFQIVFTLAVIQKKFPSFRHNDLSNANNILIRNVMDKQDKKTFDEYIVKNKVYPLSRAFQFVMIDFGLSSIKGKMASPNYAIVKNGPRFGTLLTENRNQKSDLHEFILTIFNIYYHFSNWNIQTTSQELLNDLVHIEFGTEKNMERTRVLNILEQPVNDPLYKKLKTPEQFLIQFPWNKYIKKYIPKKYDIIEEYHL